MSNYERLTALGIKLKRPYGEQKVNCHWCRDSRTNKKDTSLSVDVEKGVYNCHYCKRSGGVSEFKKMADKVYVKPVWTNVTQLSDKLVGWFKERGISQQTLISMKISEGEEWMPQADKKMNTVQFPYYRTGEVVNVKYRTGNKYFKLCKDAELVFYNIDSIDPIEVLIVEGEMDALSFIEAGYKSVLSVPNGAGGKNLDYLDNCWSYLEGVERIIIGVDKDSKGFELRDELVRRIGDERCYLIDYKDCKDGNEYLKKYGKESLTELIKSAQPIPIEGIFQANDFLEGVVEYWKNGLPLGEKIEVPGFDNLIGFLKGQLTTISGIPNHGKSSFLDFVLERLAVLRGWRIGYFSPENHPIELHISSLLEKIIGKSFTDGLSMGIHEIGEGMEFCNEHFYFIKPKDENYTLDNILDKARRMILKHGINCLVIDPWNTLEHHIDKGMSETNYISYQLSKITSFAKRYDIHIFLTAHPTKIQKDKLTGKYDIPTLYNISGSAHFFNKTDNGFCVYRDFEENKTIVVVQKVRFKHLGQVGEVEFIYNKTNGRYHVIGSEPDLENHIAKKYEQQSMEMEPNEEFLDERKDVPF